MVKPSPEQYETISLIYVKDFEAYNEKFKMRVGEHLRKGRIYRAIKVDRTFKVFFENDETIQLDGLIFPFLVDETEAWKADLVEITKNNILEYPIQPEDIPILQKWYNAKHDDMVEHLEDPLAIEMYSTEEPEIQMEMAIGLPPDEIEEELPQQINEANENEVEAALNKLVNLSAQDTDAFDFIVTLMEYFELDSDIPRLYDQYPVDLKQYTEKRHVNIYKAIELLATYSATGNMLPLSLMHAIDSIYHEFKRLKNRPQ